MKVFNMYGLGIYILKSRIQCWAMCCAMYVFRTTNFN